MTVTANSQGVLAYAIFSAAVKLADETSRQEYIELSCRGNDELRARVQQLLNADTHAAECPLDDLDPQLSGSASAAAANATTETLITDGADSASSAKLDVAKHPQIGPYKIRELLGEGGMGYVYIAEQTHPVRRKVALKVIKPGMDTKEVIARFEAERQALAMMSHPNIAKVLDAGTIGGVESPESRVERKNTLDTQLSTLNSAARPYFVMELVRGDPITTFCDQQKLTTRERLELFLQVCDAVQHAHMKGIIHRDLKPSNVIVELHDVKAVPKVIDFGVAKATGERLTQHTVYTQFSQLVGTPLYMSPEQAKQSALDIDTRSDIYSLGVMLYELLTGTTPFDKESMSSVNITELQRIICEDEPPRPSLRISTLKNEQRTTISNSRKTQPQELQLSMQRELDWIVMKALEKDRTRRYESASAFAADIRRYLDDEPVQACPPSVGYRLRKYARKHKGLLTTAAILLVMLLASTVVSAAFAYRSEQAKDDAEEAQADAEEKQVIAEQRLAKAIAVVDTMLTRVAGERLSATPQTAEVREELLQDALRFYEEFLEEAPDSIEIKKRITDVYVKRSGIYTLLSNHQALEDDRRAALEIYEAIFAEHPDDLEVRIAIAGLLQRTTDVGYSRITGYDDHRANTLRAMGLLDEVFDQCQDDASYRMAFVNAYGAYISMQPWTFSDPAADAKARMERLERVLDKWDTLTPEMKAYGIGHLGNYEVLHGTKESAEARFRAAAELDGNNVWVLLALGKLLRGRGLTDEAEACFGKVFDVEREMQALNPKHTEHGTINLTSSALVGMYVNSGRAQELIDKVTDRIDNGVASRRDYLIRGDLYVRTGRTFLLEGEGHGANDPDVARAVPDLEYAYGLHKDSFAAVLLFEAYFFLQRFDDAFGLLQDDIARPRVYWAPLIQFSVRFDAEERGRLLEAMKKIPVGEAVPYEVRGGWYGALGEYALAIADYRESISQDIGPGGHNRFYRAALLSLTTKDTAGYRKLCQQMLSKFATSAKPMETQFTAWTCALAPDSVDDYAVPLKLAESAVEAEPENQQYLNSLGAIQLRAGLPEEALATFDKSAAVSGDENTSSAYDYYFRALAEQALERTDAARQSLAKANELAAAELANEANPPAWNRKLTLELLRKEAEGVVGVMEPRTKSPQPESDE